MKHYVNIIKLHSRSNGRDGLGSIYELKNNKFVLWYNDVESGERPRMPLRAQTSVDAIAEAMLIVEPAITADMKKAVIAAVARLSGHQKRAHNGGLVYHSIGTISSALRGCGVVIGCKSNVRKVLRELESSGELLSKSEKHKLTVSGKLTGWRLVESVPMHEARSIAKSIICHAQNEHVRKLAEFVLQMTMAIDDSAESPF